MKLSKKQTRILSTTLTVFSVFMIGSGLILNTQTQPIIHTKYTVSVEKKKIAEAQAKTDEIKVKNIEIELVPINIRLLMERKNILVKLQ